MQDRSCINVGLGKIKVVRPPAVLSSIGVGSCIVLCLYHKQTGTAGMAHIMLPSKDNNRIEADKPAKYAELALENLLAEFSRLGIKNYRSLSAKIVGGAQLFMFKQVPNIGERNIKAIKKALRKCGIRIIGSDVGGNCGRSVWFYAESGKVIVRSKLSEPFEI